MTFDFQDSLQQFIGTPFDVRLQIVVDYPNVTIRIPSLNLIMPEGTPIDLPGGFIVTKNNFLPPNLRPVDAVYQSDIMLSDKTNPPTYTYPVYIGNDGTIRIYGPGRLPILPGYNSLIARTIQYTLPFPQIPLPPKNIKLSLGTNFGPPSGKPAPIPSASSGAFLDYYKNSFVNDNVAFAWSDNHNLATPPLPALINHNWVVQTGKVIRHNGKITGLNLNPQVTVYIAPIKTLQVSASEGSININPINPNNIVTFFSVRDFNTPNYRIDADSYQGWRAVSFDCGKTWPILDRIDTNPAILPGLPNNTFFRSDPTVLFDKFGHCFITFMSHLGSDFNDSNPFVLAVSNDSGVTFEIVHYFAEGIIPEDGDFYDFPQPVFGPDGSGSYVLWIPVHFYTFPAPNFSINFIMKIAYVRISSSGVIDFSSVNIDEIIVIPQNTYTLHQTTIGPDGTLYMSISDTSGACDPLTGDCLQKGRQVMFILPKGLNNPDGVANGWQHLGDIYFDNIISDPNLPTLSAPVSFQIDRGILPGAVNGMAYDFKSNRLYTAYVDKRPRDSNLMGLYLIYSKNGGKSWSDPIQINDTMNNDRALLDMQMNESGDLQFAWYDSRNSSDGTRADFFCAYLTKSQIDNFDIEMTNNICSIEDNKAIFEEKNKSDKTSKSLINFDNINNNKKNYSLLKEKKYINENIIKEVYTIDNFKLVSRRKT